MAGCSASSRSRRRRPGSPSCTPGSTSFGTLERVGVEGTGAYGAGLARFLRTMGVAVIEVGRPNRQARRAHGKSDSIDAVEAARAALCGPGERRWRRPPMATWRRSGCCSSPTAPGATPASSVSTSCAISASAAPMSCGNGSVASPSTSSPRPPRHCAPTPTVIPSMYATKLAMHTLGRRVARH